jgi:hypothetical protein
MAREGDERLYENSRASKEHPQGRRGGLTLGNVVLADPDPAAVPEPDDAIGS